MARKILETPRLYLEELEDIHFPDLYTLLSNPIVHRHFPNILDESESRKFLELIKGQYQTQGYSFWAVMRKTDKRFLGISGLLSQTIDGKEEVEVGYRIHNQFWGKYYGTEAAKGCMDYAKNVLGVQSVISLIREQNKQSIRVAEKNGLTLEKTTLFKNLPHRVYRKDFFLHQPPV